MDGKDETIRELKEKTKLYEKWGTRAFFIALILLGLIWGFTRTRDGLYLVYACNDRGACYNLRANVDNVIGGEGERGGIYVDRLFFNNGGSVELTCRLPSKFLFFTSDNYCYETEGDRTWEIELIKRIDKRIR